MVSWNSRIWISLSKSRNWLAESLSRYSLKNLVVRDIIHALCMVCKKLGPPVSAWSRWRVSGRSLTSRIGKMRLGDGSSSRDMGVVKAATTVRSQTYARSRERLADHTKRHQSSKWHSDCRRVVVSAAQRSRSPCRGMRFGTGCL